jgi:hypothetical protein
MVRTVRGITLTPEERRQAGYDKEKASAHVCSVALPNGVSCEVSYTRTSARVHAFAFGDPICRTQYAYEALPGGIPGIEAKAASLAESLFQQAQQQEQKAMRQKSPTTRTIRPRDDGPQINARLAEQLAGLYAPCVKCASGTLIRVGGTYGAPEGAVREIRDGKHGAIRLVNGQRLVVGICNRTAQKWEEPLFLAAVGSDRVPAEPDGNESEDETGYLEDDGEEPNIARRDSKEIGPEWDEGERDV